MSIRLGLQKLVSSHLYEGARIEIIIQKITSTRTSVDHILQWCVNLNGIEDNEKKYPESRTSTGAWIEIYLLADWKITNQNRTSHTGARIEINNKAP